MNAYQRRQFAVAVATTVALLLGCFAFGALTVREFRGLALIGMMFCLVVYWIKPQLMVWVALFLTVASVPEGWHMGMVFGPVSVYASHVAVMLAICYLIPIVRPRFSSYLLPGIMAFTVLFFAAVGFTMGHPADVVAREATILLEMVAGFVLGLLVVGAKYVKGAMHALAATLWFSAGMIALSSLHVVKLAGRRESLEVATGAAAAIRLTTATQFPAVVVLTGLVAAAIVGRVKATWLLALGPPALAISLLSFSRSTLMAIAVAAVVAFIANLGWSPVRRTAVFTIITAVIFTVTVPGALFLLQHSAAGAWLGDQFEAFNHRVLQQVSTNALAVDSSILARLEEDRNLNHAIAQAPIFGHGLGFAYQLPFGLDPRGFTATLGTTYSHNFYLWWLCKAGAVGMAVFAAFALTPVIRALRCASAPAKISAAVCVGLLVVCIVAPMPEETANALTLGVALGMTSAFAKLQREPHSREQMSPEPMPLPRHPEPFPAPVHTEPAMVLTGAPL